MTRLDPVSRPELWFGGAHWSSASNAWEPRRLPPSDLRDFDDPDFVEKSRMAAGVRLRLTTDANSIEATIEQHDDQGSPMDLVVDGELVARTTPRLGITTLHAELPPGVHDVELWLPHFGRMSLHDVAVRGSTAIAPAVRGPRWLAYGSSITHCKRADGPSSTWPALVDRALGWDHTNLGLGGQCHLDPPARRALVNSDVPLRLVCAGINIYQSATFGPRGLPPQLGGFLMDVLAAHPGDPLVLVSPISSPSREHEPNAHGLTLDDVRRSVESVGAVLSRSHPEVSVISGPELLGLSEADELLEDGLHPGQSGMAVIAERLAARLGRIP